MHKKQKQDVNQTKQKRSQKLVANKKQTAGDVPLLSMDDQLERFADIILDIYLSPRHERKVDH